MAKVEVPNAGALGVFRDLSQSELPIGAWTDASNIRFLDGYAHQFLGHGQVYNTPAYAPQYLMPVNVAGVRYWMYATATKQFVVNNSGGVTTHTDITHVTPRAGVVNQWTGGVLGGIPILNAGDGTKPMYWDQVLANKFVDVPAWPVNVSAKVIRTFKNFVIGLNITKATGVNYPFMMKWGHPAVPGSLPSTYDETDATKDAGEFDFAEGQDPVIDGLTLKESFIVYKEQSAFRADYVGGAFIFSNKKIFGMSGIMNRNCAVEFDSYHFVVTGSDIVVHDGYTANSVLDKKGRRNFFQSIDVTNKGLVFCFKNPFLNEIFVAFPGIGSSVCDQALVYNWVDKTVSYRTLPNVNHANFGPVDNSLGANWNQVSDPWDSMLRSWGGPDFTPDTVRVLMGSSSLKLYMLDASASFDGVAPVSYMERRGLHLGAPERMKMITGIRPRITGNVGQTVTVKIGYADNAYADPTYTTMSYIIGTTVQCDCMVPGRCIAVWIGSGTAYQWRLDSYDLMVEDEGEW